MVCKHLQTIWLFDHKCGGKLSSMPGDLPPNGQFFIAEWTVEPELNAISRDGVTIHLEPKVMKVLLQLAMAPGHVVTKEHLIETVWPDTFVSDDVLTRCISVLRREMRDDTHAPRYIQTIPKTGYRLVAEVRAIEQNGGNHIGMGNGPATTSDPAAAATNPVEPDHRTQEHVSGHDSAANPVAAVAPSAPRRRKWGWVTAIAAVAVFAAVGFAIWRFRPRSVLPALSIVPLTSYTGEQDQGAFSPDGTRVVFAWTTPEDGNRNLFVKQTGSETLLRLTNAAESDYSPAWSPDGTRIAYLALSDKGLGLYVVSSLGGPAEKLYTPRSMVHWEQRALSWSPDGKSLLFPDGTPSSIQALSLDTRRAYPVSTPPQDWDGDVNPAFSPDGTQIAFVRAMEGAVRDIYVVSAMGGTPRQLTNDRRLVDTLAWTRDSSAVLFSSDRGGKFALWRVPLRGGEPQRLPVGTEDATQPAVSLSNHRLLYTEGSATWSILAIPLHSGSDPNRHHESEKTQPVVASTQQDSAPSFAPDGSRFAFQSWRSGSQELWIATRDGQTLRQLTSYGRGLTGSPSFSPDGQSVAFDARPEGHSHIFVIAANGGTPRELTTGNANDILPRWSADGRFLYFASNRSGNWQTWKVALAGGQPQQVTATNGYLAMESPDGRWVYFTKTSEPGIWRMPAGGGQGQSPSKETETRILPQPPDGYWGYWAVTPRGIYFLDATQPRWRIQLYEPETQRISTAAVLDRRPPPFSGISVDPRGQELLITDEVNASSHITLVENFPDAGRQ
jgi:Tol biopolymer transport system component/DNA-binding winged helix-turn-helix (wHTH) protein